MESELRGISEIHWCLFIISDTKIKFRKCLDILAGFISESKLKLVYGGGKRGLMGKLSEKVSKKWKNQRYNFAYV